LVRQLLQRLNYHFTPPPAQEQPIDPRLVEALRQLPGLDAGARAYLEKHLPRLARTLSLVPPPQKTSRILELGCYMQITPFLQRISGYKEVRGAYYGPLGRTDHKIIEFPDGRFECDVDLFDAEKDPFPYPDEHFDAVIAGEIIEHFLHDPMQMLLESRRILIEGGHLIVTTPNVGSLASVAKTLDGRDNPQIYFLYKRPAPGAENEIGHMREYTIHELGETVKAAGFEIKQLFTTFLPDFATHRPLLCLLAQHGYNTEHRGEQTWCVAVKKSNLPIDRYPWFLYES
jgi:SAM-dependent methyltransferase